MENRGEYIRQARQCFDSSEDMSQPVLHGKAKARFGVSILLFLLYLFCDKMDIAVLGFSMKSIGKMLQYMPNW